MIDWLPGYEQVQITGCTGPNSYVNGYPWRLVLHSTESPFGSINAVTNLFRGQPCSTPHFCIDPGTRRKVQYIPITWSAAALRGGRNGYETNRGHAIQVEICGRADEAEGWSDDVLDFIAGFVADVAREVPINLNNVTSDDRRGTYAVENSPYRFSPEQWKQFDGLCDHANVPFNDHYDVARLNKHRIADLAKQKLGQPVEEGPEVVTDEDVKRIAEASAFLLSGKARLEGASNAPIVDLEMLLQEGRQGEQLDQLQFQVQINAWLALAKAQGFSVGFDQGQVVITK